MTTPTGKTPAMVVLYGATGKGKSVESVYSFSGRGLFLAQPGALRSAETVVGVSIADRTIEAATMQSLPALIQQAAESGYEAIVVDDATLLMKNTIAELRVQFTTGTKNGVISSVDWGMYTALTDLVSNIARVARWCGIHVVLNAHVQPCFTDKDGAEYLAGPDLGWKKLITLLPHTADLVCLVRGVSPNTPSWDTRMDCDSSSFTHLMKDRFAVAPAKGGPLNLAELLRAAGHHISRPAGMEWMEGPVAAIASDMLAGVPEQQARAPRIAKMAEKGIHPFHQRWVLRDGTHRGRFALHAATSVLEGF